MGHQAREAAGDALEQARDSAGELYDEGRERMLDLAGSVRETVRDQPLRSLLVAMGIGCVFGAFFMRR
jgi:ElaB/YqjD/DUF883 family membrane-anchored ribosome-binding protein